MIVSYPVLVDVYWSQIWIVEEFVGLEVNG